MTNAAVRFLPISGLCYRTCVLTWQPCVVWDGLRGDEDSLARVWGPRVVPPSSGHVHCVCCCLGGHLTLESWISWLCDLVLAKQTWIIMASGLKSFAQWKRFLAYTRIIHSSLERIQKLKRRYTRKWQHRCFHSAWEDLSISQAARGNHDYGIWGDPTREPKEQKGRTVGHVD